MHFSSDTHHVVNLVLWCFRSLFFRIIPWRVQDLFLLRVGEDGEKVGGLRGLSLFLGVAGTLELSASSGYANSFNKSEGSNEPAESIELPEPIKSLGSCTVPEPNEKTESLELPGPLKLPEPL